VDDLVDGLIRLMNSDAAVTGPANLGDPVEFTMRELAQLVLAETGSSSPLVTQPQADPKQRKPTLRLPKNISAGLQNNRCKRGRSRPSSIFAT
jgi:UDP-glucuronate decarboxylase